MADSVRIDKYLWAIRVYKTRSDATDACNGNKVQINGVNAKKWSILANYADSSLLRNKIGYDLACELGIGIESKYIDIWINGKYNGNYLITPKSDYNAPENGYALELDNRYDSKDSYFALDGLSPSEKYKNVINRLLFIL